MTIPRRRTMVWHLMALVLPSLCAPVSASAQAEWRTDFSRTTVPLEEIVSGGPPKDGIPALDSPSFISVSAADRWIGAREPVIVVVNGDAVRIYPYQILIWHEIVNDVVGDLPLTITYCPLCNTALVFHRRFGDRLLDFGTTGKLRHSDMVMYDRQTETWWQQATGEGIVGELSGEQLEAYPAQSLSWDSAKEAHPTAQVLSRTTGYSRPYGRNPYTGYDQSRGPISSFFSKALDDRLGAMDRVAAVTLDARPVAYPFSALREKRVVNDQVAGQSLVVWWVPGTASALDSQQISDGRDVGSSGVFLREVGSRTLTFSPLGDNRFEDRETGSMWNASGTAIAGPLAGETLRPLAHGDYLWFAWAAFRPETEIRGR